MKYRQKRLQLPSSFLRLGVLALLPGWSRSPTVPPEELAKYLDVSSAATCEKELAETSPALRSPVEFSFKLQDTHDDAPWEIRQHLHDSVRNLQWNLDQSPPARIE